MTAVIVEEREEEELELPMEPVEDIPEEPEEPEIPEKYQGKTVREVIDMHKEAEKLLGRQSSEVGELRKTVDTFINTQLSTEPTSEVEEVDYFDDPKTAVHNAVSTHPDVIAAKEYNEAYRKETALSSLKQKHPDMDAVLQDASFNEWIGASKIRTNLYTQANQQYDMDAADELFSNWKERKGIITQTAELEKKSRKQAMKTASTGSSGGTGEVSKKIYRRTDIIKMMRNDPEGYANNADEILLAYSQGRVK